MKHCTLLLICLLIFSLSTNARELRRIQYEASYLGVSLLDMELTWIDNDSTVSISYDNQLKPFIAYFHPIHNVYKVEFLRDSFEPLSWSKDVSEGSMNFFLGAGREPGSAQINYSNGQTRDLPEGAFTVFSATHFLASKAQDAAFFPAEILVMIDGETWSATALRFTASEPHPEFDIEPQQTLIQTRLHLHGGTRVMKQNDILMAVIATEGTQFYLWVEADGTYSRAQFGHFPRAVVLERVGQ